MNKRLFIVFALGFSSGLPLSLVSSTLQAWFAQSGMTVFATGMLSLLGLPYMYRVLWGPLLDHYSLTRLGRRRSWMLLMQSILLIGLFCLSWCSPTNSFLLMAFIAFIIACCSATQDMAIEAHRTEYLSQQEHGLGASLAVFGYRLALLLSGGIALIMAQHIGWGNTYRMLAALMVIGIIMSLWSPEPSRTRSSSTCFQGIYIAPFKELLMRPKALSLLCFILLYKLGEAFTTTTSGIVMPFLIQGLGFPLDTIGYINKIAGVGAIISGGLVAGFFLMHQPLYRALLLFGLLQALTNVLFVWLAVAGKNTNLLLVAVLFDNFAAGMGTTALVAMFMRVVSHSYTATQFSILAAISTIPRIFSGPFAAMMQSWIGWVGLYQVSVILALGFIPFLIKIRYLLERGWEVDVNDGLKSTKGIAQ